MKIKDQRRIDWWKKAEDRKSCDTVPWNLCRPGSLTTVSYHSLVAVGSAWMWRATTSTWPLRTRSARTTLQKRSTYCELISVANRPKYLPQNAKVAPEKSKRPKKSATEIFSRFHLKKEERVPNFFDVCFSHKI
jgi:hypothetical protein